MASVDRATWTGKSGGPGSNVQSQFVYEPLPPGDSIRLLELNPGSDDEALHATVVVSRLEAQPKYAAVSYVWGDRDEVTPLMINGVIMLIEQNLAHALSAVRDRERQCYFWIDAVCINQDDGFEKASQVKRMAEIYRRAESIVIWLQADYGDIRWQTRRDCHLYNSESSAGPSALLANYNHSLCSPAVAEIVEISCKPKSPETLPVNQRPDGKLILEDFAECQSRLHRLFSTCEDDEFPFLSITLSTTLTSFRALRLAEVARVVALSMSTDMSLKNMDDFTRFLAIRGLYQDTKAQYLEAMLRGKWSEVLYISPQGYVQFTRESMGFFFSQFPIRGVDTKHEIMANACLRELEFGAILAEMDQSVGGNSCNSPCAASDLSLYAAQFWHRHYRLAQDLSPGLSERLHKLLWGRLRAVSHPHLADQLSLKTSCSFRCDSCAEPAFAYCEKRGFKVLWNAYAQVKAISHAGYGAARKYRELECQGQRLGITFSRCHIRSDDEGGLNSCRSLGGELSDTVIPWDANSDSDSADSTASEADWLIVDYPNMSSNINAGGGNYDSAPSKRGLREGSTDTGGCRSRCYA